MASFDFIKDLPTPRSEIEDFLNSYEPKNNFDEKIISAIRTHYDIIKTINEELTSIEVSGKLSSNAYSIIKKFGKEVEAKSLREIRRELLEDITHLKIKL